MVIVLGGSCAQTLGVGRYPVGGVGGGCFFFFFFFVNVAVVVAVAGSEDVDIDWDHALEPAEVSLVCMPALHQYQAFSCL